MTLRAIVLLILAVPLAAAALSGQVPAAVPGEPLPDAPAVVATVNGEPLFLEALEERLEEMHGRVEETRRSAFDLEALTFRLVNDALIAQEARALELDLEPPVPDRIEARRRELAVRRLEREEIWSQAAVSDEEVRASFEELYRRVTLRVITTHEEAEAAAVLAELAAGADFETLARERSKDPYGPRGGLVQSLPRSDLQRAIAEVAFGLEPGKTFGPVATEIGWAVLEVAAFEPPDEERFAAVRREIAETVRFRKAEAAREALGVLLRERHTVTVDADAVASIARERLPDGRLVPRPADPSAAVARIGERRITAEAFARALMVRWAGVRNEVAAEAAAPIVLDRMIAGELLAAEALARGYGETPGALRELRAYETRLLVNSYLDQVLAPTIEVRREEMEANYEARRESFGKPPRLRLAQITVPTREEAERIAQLAAEGADFAWLARRHSTDGYREAGGDKGWVEPRPGVDALNEALLAASVGDVLPPFETAESAVVHKVTAREERGVYAFEEVSGNVRRAVFDRKARAAIDALVTALRERSEIVVHQEVLDRLAVDGEVGEEPAPGGMMPGHGQGDG
ncbi:MAG TPA: peptidyl-prolyl cis-trans isomerase [Thermoanaerobaculia bacterium]|nr:peptidyl-prolyl cis-trans isomerase [Thermoanaerobaculia bacterium]